MVSYISCGYYQGETTLALPLKYRQTCPHANTDELSDSPDNDLACQPTNQWSSMGKEGKLLKRLKLSLPGRQEVRPAHEDPITASRRRSWPTITASPWSNGCHLSGQASATAPQQAGWLAQTDTSYLVLLHTHKLILSHPPPLFSQTHWHTQTGESSQTCKCPEENVTRWQPASCREWDVMCKRWSMVVKSVGQGTWDWSGQIFSLFKHIALQMAARLEQDLIHRKQESNCLHSLIRPQSIGTSILPG